MMDTHIYAHGSYPCLWQIFEKFYQFCRRQGGSKKPCPSRIHTLAIILHAFLSVFVEAVGVESAGRVEKHGLNTNKSCNKNAYATLHPQGRPCHSTQVDRAPLNARPPSRGGTTEGFTICDKESLDDVSPKAWASSWHGTSLLCGVRSGWEQLASVPVR